MFTNAKIIDIGADSTKYHAGNELATRGTPDFIMSSSGLRLFASCPSKWRAGFEMPPSASLEYGSLFDTLVLTPDQFQKRYAMQPAEYKSEKEGAKKWNNNATVCREWNAAQKEAGREVVSQGELADAQAAVKRLYEDEVVKPFLDACDRQVWVEAIWHDKKTGLKIKCKCLIDLAAKADSEFHKSLGDLKTTKNADILAWEKWAHFAGYEIQAAWNTDMFVAATKREITNFCFVLSENSHPWEPGRRMMGQDFPSSREDMGDIASGRRQYVQIMENYCACLKAGKWPGYDDTDESAQGWSVVNPNPYDEQRRAFAPRFSFDFEEPKTTEEQSADLIP